MKAQAVFIVLIVLMVASVTSLLWGMVISERLHLATEASEAVKAFYAADSVLDCKFYQIYYDSSEACPPDFTNNTKASFTTSTYDDTTLIKAVGWTITTQIYRALTAKF